MDLQALKNKYDIIGNDPVLNNALETAVKFAPTGLSVLIQGESGVGKESVARIIHQYSPRRQAPLFIVNCGALPKELVNSELFGHVKGSFTGAVDNRRGYFEEADGGTLFLDEIAELPAESQALLLRVLQSGEYRKVGSNKVEHTDVRVVAATNVNLYEAVKRGKFREDLYFRLSAAQIRIPPLRERKADIYLLFRKFTSDFSEVNGMCKISLRPDAIHLLEQYRRRLALCLLAGAGPRLRLAYALDHGLHVEYRLVRGAGRRDKHVLRAARRIKRLRRNLQVALRV